MSQKLEIWSVVTQRRSWGTIGKWDFTKTVKNDR